MQNTEVLFVTNIHDPYTITELRGPLKDTDVSIS